MSSAIASYFEKHDHPKTTRADYTQATNALIADSLARTKVKLKRREFLRPEQIRKLIECCEQQDAETFELCRDGSTDTPRYEPILPFVKFVLFTGMRVSEAQQICEPDVEDGELHVRAESQQEERGADGRHDDLHDVDVDEAA